MEQNGTEVKHAIHAGASGFAGIDNPLFFRDNSYMIFGDAKATVEGLVTEFKESA